MKSLIALGIFGIILLIMVLTMITAFLWYTFDDSLAEVTNIPELGELPFFMVWPACLFTSALLKGNGVGANIGKVSREK